MQGLAIRNGFDYLDVLYEAEHVGIVLNTPKVELLQMVCNLAEADAEHILKLDMMRKGIIKDED